MAFKPNYNQQRAERNRAAQAKKEAKLREQEAAVARRRAGPQDTPPADAQGEDAQADARTDATAEALPAGPDAPRTP
jgi:hypothetical protein